ncbi:MAG: PQQ-binding-like beta-propeller repeat protein [Pirellulales bacterium]
MNDPHSSRSRVPTPSWRLADRLLRASAALLVTLPLLSATAGDWPQILGPRRDGVADGETLPASWPAGGPVRLWRVELGQGYAGPAVAGQRVVVFHRVGSQERIEAFDLGRGTRLWKADFPASYRGGYDSDLGPRCVPVIAGDAVVVYGPAGDLRCVALQDGTTRWSRSLLSELGGEEGYFGAGSTPLVVGQRVLVNVGGRDGAGIVACDLATGQTVWSTGEDAASYAAPTLTTHGQQPAAVFVTRLHCVAVDPATGKTLFRFPFGKRGPTVNAATPLVFDQQLFVSASYGVGAALKDWSGESLANVWDNDDTLSSQYTTPVYYEGRLYGTHGREDVGRAALRCVVARSGQVAWEVPNFGVAHVIRAGDKLLLVTADGRVVLAQATPAAFRSLGEFTLPDVKTRALPALASGRLLLRTTRAAGGGELVCFSSSGTAP